MNLARELVIPVDNHDEQAWNELVARYRECEVEIERTGERIWEQYADSPDRGRLTAIDTTGPYLETLREFQDIVDRCGESADYELRADARLLAHDLGDRLRRVPFDDLDDDQQDDFLMYSYFFDNPLDDQTNNWSYSRENSRELYETYSTLSFWFDWINHLEYGTPFPIERNR